MMPSQPSELLPPEPPPAPAGILRSLWQNAVAMARYYRANAGALWRFGVEVAPFLEHSGDRTREIRITRADAIGTAAFEGDEWRLEFPDCCVITGEPTTVPWLERTETHPNVACPFWGTVAGVCGGLFLSLLIKIWLWPLFVILGMAVGYAKRQTRTVWLRFRRSRADAEGEEVPQVWLLPDGLLVRLGSPAAKKAFVQHRVDRQTADRGAAMPIAPRPDVSSLKLEDADAPPDSNTSSSMRPPVAPPVRDELPPIQLDD